MGIFSFLHSPDINEGVETFRNTEGAVLIDVRTEGEYSQGHIPESCNIPLQAIQRAAQEIGDKNTPLFVHCLSGARSGQAVSFLKRMGYQNVTNIGGISKYRGKVVR